MTETSPDLGELLSEAIAAAEPSICDRIDADPSAYLDLVVLAARANAETVNLLQSAVSSARSAGHSWEAIGQTLSMTRQAAQQRFGKSPGQATSTSEGQVRTLSPLTSFDELEILNHAGRYGWHSIGFGTLYHTVARSDRQWEHQRVYILGRNRRGIEAGGWQRIGGMWFPWAYYKRCLDVPALPEPRHGDHLLARRGRTLPGR